ncbi:MAG: FAD-binding oxidoreductase, partial [Mesorhizobium sp.]
IGQEQSSRNWGWVRISRRDPREVPLMAEALRIWTRLSERTGRDTGYARAGIVFTCANDKEYEQHASWGRHLEGYQLESRMIGAGELRDLLPGSSLDVKGALYTPA